MTTNKILLINSERLGIRNSVTIQKAEAFLRILNTKTAAKTISDAAKIVLCLDLAATSSGIGFDKNTALKLAGLRKGVYQNNLNNLEKMLDLDKPLTISELCVQLSCTEIKETAETILQSYKEHDTKIKDIRHPQYVAAAVFTSCKLKRVKVDKSQLRAISRLKLSQWNELLEEFGKFTASLGLSRTKEAKKNASTEQEELMEVVETSLKTKSMNKEDKMEDYDVWRERILHKASAEVLQREMKND
jgi:origin recognition complex subunit 6